MTQMNLNTTMEPARETTTALSHEAASRRPLDRCVKGMLDRLASVQLHKIRDGIRHGVPDKSVRLCFNCKTLF